jgi:hypothetical protein
VLEGANSVVDQDVESAHCARLIEKTTALANRADISTYDVCPTAELTDRVGHLLGGLRGVEVVDGNIGASPSQGDTNGGTDPARAPCD